MTRDYRDRTFLQADDPAEFGGDGDEETDDTATEPGGGDGKSEGGGEGIDVSVGDGSEETSDGGATDGASPSGDDPGGIGTGQGPQDTGDDGDGMFGFDVGEYLTDMAVEISEQLSEGFATLLEVMVNLIVGTPAPNSIFRAPTNEPWATAYAYYQSDIITLSLLLFVAVIAAITLGGTIGGILSSYQTKQLWWRAIFAFVFIYFWWPAGALALNFEHWLATFIAPDAADFTGSLENILAGITGAAVVVVLLKFVATSLIIGIAAIYGARYVAIVGLMVFMIVFAMLWVVNVSLFNRLSNLASGLMSTFIPVLFLTLPTAILMRVGLFIFEAGASANWLSAPALIFLGLGCLVASFVAPKYTFSIANSFMAQSYGAERLGNMIDNQYSRGKDRVSNWYGDNPEEPPEQPTNPPTSGERDTTGDGTPTLSTAQTDSHSSRPRINPSAGSNSPTTKMTAAQAPSSTATGSPSPSNKYASQQRADNYRINSRRRELTDDLTQGFD